VIGCSLGGASGAVTLVDRVLVRAALLGVVLVGCSDDGPPTPDAHHFPRDGIPRNPPTAFLSPEESAALFQLPPGLSIELVAAEPLVEEPVALSWDADGRMYVVEMRGYMRDVDGSGETDPTGRVVRLEDTDGDGVMDRRSVYLGGLVEPRAVLALDDEVLIAEPPNLWLCTDTDDDGVADRKRIVHDGYGTGWSVEHRENGLLWALDNWIYSANSTRKLRFFDGELEEARTASRGQWGISQDDRGRLYHTRNATPFRGEQVPLDYWLGDATARRVRIRQRLAGDFAEIWPIIGTPDVQGGPEVLRADGTLAGFTALGGATVFRGDRLGAEYAGDAFLPEPVGRLLRRAVFQETAGIRSLSNPYGKVHGEFLASTDANFRPVNTFTGPDGCLYIVDMYRGIIQHAAWMTEGSYLREQVERLGLDANVGRGRIWRIVADGVEPGPAPRLSSATPTELVAALGHPNGWWRDTAQKLLVLRRDPEAVPRLRELVREGAEPRGRLHALWTLEGLDSLDIGTLRAGLADDDPRVVEAAIRLAEPVLLVAEDERLLDVLADVANGAEIEIAKQLVLTLGRLDGEQARELLADVALAHVETEILPYVASAGIGEHELALLRRLHEHPLFALEQPTEAQRLAIRRWYAMLAGSLLQRGDAEDVAELLAFAAALPPWYRIELLSGMIDALPMDPSSERKGDPAPHELIRFDAEPAPLAAMRAVEERALQVCLSLAGRWFTWPGEARHELSVPTLGDAERARYSRGQDIFETLCEACHGPTGRGMSVVREDYTLWVAPPLAGSPRLVGDPDTAIAVLLHGLTGSLDGREYTTIMSPMGDHDDEWLASVLSFVRRSWGANGSVVTPERVAAVRERTKSRGAPWTQAGLENDRDG